MTRIAVLTTKQQQWLRACNRITGSAHNSGSPSDYYDYYDYDYYHYHYHYHYPSTRKRTRTFATAATTAVSAATIPSGSGIDSTPAISDARTGTVHYRRCYHSSKPDPKATRFPNPLHRNPWRIASSVGSIYKPPGYFLGINDNDDDDDEPVILPADDEVVANSVRSCIKIDETEHVDFNAKNAKNAATNAFDKDWSDPHDRGLNTEMSLCFLGTGAGSPANIRSTSGAFLRLAGTTFLFDVGEGTQRQFQFARGGSSSISKIDKIFVTHLHGDHIFGLPGLLLSLQTALMQSDDEQRQAKQKQKQHQKQQHKQQNQKQQHKQHQKQNQQRRRKAPRDEDDLTIKIYGPPGLFNYIAAAITLSCTRLHLLNVEVYELVGGRVRRVVTPPSSSSSSSSSTSRRHLPRGGSSSSSPPSHHHRDPFHSDYPELRHNGGRLRRFEIPCRDGVWDIQYNPLPLSRDEITTPIRRNSPGGGKSLARQKQDRIRIRAAEVDHMPGVATFGFVIEEDEPPRNLDVARAKALGVSHRDKKYELLKHGFAVTADDGSERRVEPHEVLRAPTKKARKIAVVGDNRGWTRQMTEIARKADVLVHEATLSQEDPTRGHSTAAMAGRNAAGCDARLLILNHISPRMESNLSEVVREAYDASRQKLSVLMSFDFMEVVVPWMGFGTDESDTSTACDTVRDTDPEFGEKDGKQ